MADETIIATIELTDSIEATIGIIDTIVVTVPEQGPAGPEGPIGATGSTGPTGPQGPAGVGVSFEWDQNSASAQWNINHNFGCHPSVTIVDSSGREVWGDVQYIDQNNVQLNFQSAFGGKAYLN